VRLRFALAGLVVATAFLAACSSGTSCVFGPGGGCPPFPTPTPSAPPAPVSLAGTETQAFTYDYGYPSPEPPYTQTTTIAQTVTVAPTALASPFPAGAANDVHVAETDVVDQLQTIALTTDAYTATSGTNVLLYGSVVDTPSFGNGQASIEQLVYAAPQIVDQTPQNNGATWTNEPAAQLTERYSDGHSEDRTIANNGTYREVGTALSPDGSGYVPVHLFDDASGAGSYSGPFYGFSNLTFDFAAPAGNPPSIVATYEIGKRKKHVLSDAPAWFQANPVFFTEADSIQTNVSQPSGCAFAGGVNDVRQKITRRDTIIGYVEQSQRDTYEASGSIVCVVFTDTLQNYYDWNGDTTAFVVFISPNGKKISQVLTSEVISAVAAPGGASARRTRAPHGVRGAVIPVAAVAALQARFDAKMDETKRALFKHKRGVR
jgi:hypothetical protein